VAQGNQIIFLGMSSCLCKKAEGAVFPLLVEAIENRVDDAFDAQLGDEADQKLR
jgi:hypothetical protein